MRTYLPIIIVLMLLGIAAYFFNRNVTADAHLQTTDSLQAKALLPGDTNRVQPAGIDTVKAGNSLDTIKRNHQLLPQGAIDTKGADPAAVVAFARTLVGVPYVYASSDPATGFDCSGYITYVFRRFGITVPRSSIDFTHVGQEVTAVNARPGDLILFTGTDSTDRFVGHMGIVESNTDSLRFLHSTSGKAMGVTITALNGYYQKRFVKVIRIFPEAAMIRKP
jgi:cell wall-associated NlpC family hydrolase